MQTKSTINWKKLLQSAVLTGFIAAPVFGAATTSQAAPRDYAPAYGYRDRDNRRDHDSHEDHHDDDGNYRNRDNRNDDNFYNSTRTLEGVVVNDLAGRNFVLRLDNGRTIRVRLDEREPRRLSQGDRVRVQGSFDQTNRDNRDNTRYNDRLVFRATEVRVIRDRNNNNRNNNNNYNGQRTLNGIVTSVRSDRSFTLSALNRTFDVTSSSRLPRGLREGNIIRVSGEVRGDNISDADVTVLSQGNVNGNYRGGYNGNTNGSSSNNVNVNFPATVIDSNERNNTLRVRGENGREYIVATREADNWDRGDRVRIKGRVQNGVIVADDIDKR